jgi:hypothetical protein
MIFPGCIWLNNLKHERLTYRMFVKFLLVLASTVILASKSHGTQDHNLPSDGSGSLQTTSDTYWLTLILLLVLASTVILGSEFHGNLIEIIFCNNIYDFCFGPHREHTVFPAQRPTDWFCLRKLSLLVLRKVRNLQLCTVGGKFSVS